MTNKSYLQEGFHAEPEFLNALDLHGLRKELEKFNLAILPNITKSKLGTCLACGSPCHPEYTFHEHCLYSIDYIRNMIRDILRKESKGVKAI